jgi:hypothetical protein
MGQDAENKCSAGSAEVDVVFPPRRLVIWPSRGTTEIEWGCSRTEEEAEVGLPARYLSRSIIDSWSGVPVDERPGSRDSERSHAR